MKSKKVLIVVEGKSTERKVLESKDYGLLPFIENEYEVVSFCNDIYELYKAYKNGEYDDSSNCSQKRKSRESYASYI